MEQNPAVEIPSYYLCPISLQLMRDPVTLPTGITYDRPSIERWLDSTSPLTCPVTRQPVPDSSLTPNHTLRRLIQSWCSANSAHGYEPPPTPKPPLEPAYVAELMASAANETSTRAASLRQLRQITSESERNRKCVESTPGMVTFLASLVSEQDSMDEALALLCSLQLSESKIIEMIEKNSDLIHSLTITLQKSSNQSRARALQLLKSITEHISPARTVNVQQGLFQELVNALRDEVATKATLYVLAGLCPFGRNRINAVRAGSVPVLIEMLLDEPERRICELGLVVLDRLCGCAEGRADLAAHGAGIAVVGKKILAVSPLASERAVRVLWSVGRHVATPAVLNEMAQVGAVGKLCLVAEGEESGVKTKEKAMELLRFNQRVWRNSPCLLPQFLSLYPSPSPSPSASPSS